MTAFSSDATDQHEPFEQFDTSQKAFQLNLDRAVYGTLAEIGAGQEVARWFFRVGGASGTIAKTMSAYDMKFSDAIYGPTKRYVSQDRLTMMLKREYELLLERLSSQRGHECRFFAFANTVATKSFKNGADGHGWMGIRFQHEPQAAPSEVIIHVRLQDSDAIRQQDALGIVGVNLIFGATKQHQNLEYFLRSLMNNLSSDRLEIDMIQMIGPAFKTIDSRLLALQLVELGLTKAAMFTAQGKVVQPAEALYNKPVLLERGLFQPPSRIHLDMLDSALAHFVQEPQNDGEEPVVLLEINLKQLGAGAPIAQNDFLELADKLASLGHPVLVSNYYRYFRLTDYLSRSTKKMIGLAMGVPSLAQLFEERYYTDLEGGILESFGRMFKNDLVVYAYPTRHRNTRPQITAENLKVAPQLRHLYSHLLENRKIMPIQGSSPELDRTPPSNRVESPLQEPDEWASKRDSTSTVAPWNQAINETAIAQ